MKIGILTFHWATNYGAVLQCYALQSYLESKGHNVKVINYKPRQYDDNLLTFLRFRKFLHISEYLEERKKEKVLIEFRNKHLDLTERVYSFNDISTFASQFDAIISGSDQVLNPSFLVSGEGKGVVTPSYFFGFAYSGRRIGFALSFGCVKYPDCAIEIAERYIKNFDVISVRENTGVDIVRSMGRNDAIIVPDPTLLMPSQFYHKMADESIVTRDESYIYGFFIRNISDREQAINDLFYDRQVLWNNQDGDYSIFGWLQKIRQADFVITDSYHCLVMCLKLHTPFSVITEHRGLVGMNDRVYTLLDMCDMPGRIIGKDDLLKVEEQLSEEIDWNYVDRVLADYAENGKEFLKLSLQ
ncbi:MAG: polysaccharide pyruvyl transferase family protein [Bacteroidaceae bacterium]|nr:polysaccharide pyruvyl transferase family protein [Bacteroidaceae bacterium]